MIDAGDRRSSRIFPIQGETEQEMRTSLREFFITKMKIPARDIQEEDIEQVRRVRLRRDKEGLGEVTVLFCDLETRDRMVSYARNLGPFVDSAGKPTAGIRFEIPDYLSGVHKTLLQYGHALWNKYNKDAEFKRNVRFSDVDMSFCLDVKIPGKVDWTTVSYEREMREKRFSLCREDEDDALSLDGPRPRPLQGGTKRGINAAGGSFTQTSWRAPTSK